MHSRKLERKPSTTPHAYSRRRNDPGKFGGRLQDPHVHPRQAPLASKGGGMTMPVPRRITRSLRLQSDCAYRRQTKVKMSAIAKQFRRNAKQSAKLCAIL